MKLRILFILSCIVMPAMLVGQTTDEVQPPVYVGPIVAANAGINATNYGVSGTARNVTPGSAFGVMMDYPVSRTASVIAMVQYYTLAFEDENIRMDDPIHDIDLYGKLVTKGHFSYVGITTMFKVSGFMFGMQFGIPAGSEIKNTTKDAGTVSSYVGDISPASSDVNFMFEARIGGEFTFFKSRLGEMRLGFTGGYPFTIMANKSSGMPKLDTNFRIPNIMVHAAWLFNFFN